MTDKVEVKVEFKEYRIEYQNMETKEIYSEAVLLSTKPIIGESKYVNGKNYTIIAYEVVMDFLKYEIENLT